MIMLKDIDLTNKCGSCDHFRKMDGTAQGECLKNPYGENVVHDPKHPYWIVSRSRAKCRWYNAPPPTNADRIRSMTDEELAELLVGQTYYRESAWSEPSYLNFLTGRSDAYKDAVSGTKEWLQQPAEEDI